MYEQLLKLAASFREELEENLKKPIHPHFDSIEKILVRNNIVPLYAGKEVTKDVWTSESFLGKGSFNEVYRVLYKGKERVAKITKNENDITNATALSHLRKSFGKYSKFIMEVFDMIEDNQSGYYILIVEKLEPLNWHLKEIILGYEAQTKSLLHSITKETIMNLLIYSDFDSTLDENQLNHLAEKIIEFFHNLKNYDDEKNTIENLLEFFFKKELKLMGVVLFKERTIFITKIENILRHYAEFPVSSGVNQYIINEVGFSQFEEIPETKEFMEFLNYLQERKGIDWSDLHAENLMQRPGTNDIVICDPGYFGGL